MSESLDSASLGVQGRQLLARWCTLSSLLIVASVPFGAAIGFVLTSGIWELANPNHAPWDAVGGLWGLLLGVPVGGDIGFTIALWYLFRLEQSSSQRAGRA